MATTSRAVGSSPGEAVRTICIQISAVVVVGAVAYLMPSLVVPPLLAIVLAMITSLVVYEAGSLFRQLVGQLDRISTVLARSLGRSGVKTAAATPEDLAPDARA
jgi:hypothetical protein